MREDLKGRNLTFTEIAKLVGESWQSLDPSEREPFEAFSQKAKDKYNQDLANYKKTDKYREYNEYLAEFKAKQAGNGKGSSRASYSPPAPSLYVGSSATRFAPSMLPKTALLC